MRESRATFVKTFLVSLNLMEEIGWKAQQQDSKLKQEIPWLLSNKLICAPSWNTAVSAFTLLCMPPALMVLCPSF
jgi:hypothetical protein